jgi:cardiolipin synthase
MYIGGANGVDRRVSAVPSAPGATRRADVRTQGAGGRGAGHMTILGWAVSGLPYVALVLVALLSLAAASHAVLFKRDPRSAVGWTGIILLAPLLGAVLYVLFGINRTQRRAAKIHRRRVPVNEEDAVQPCTPEAFDRALEPDRRHLAALARIGDACLQRPLLHGNTVTPLIDGEEAYPAMLRAIDQAERSVTLASYIFKRDEAGGLFIDALGRAAARGVAVRVLLDDVGAGFGSKTVDSLLRYRGAAVERFHPLHRPWRSLTLNLRNHRKLLVVDGRVGFTGGMNVCRHHLVALAGAGAMHDVHFRIEGPAVNHVQEMFAEDWALSAGETLSGDLWFPRLEPRGPVVARGIPLDPGAHFEVLRWIALGALACARHSVRVMTPYFLPDAALIAALNVAAMRGVEVDILIPSRSDVLLVQWASTALLWQVLEKGCRVWLSPPPFDHTKLMIVDGAWSLFGSANWDPRSLRLNFEFNVEAYDRALAEHLERHIDARRRTSRQVTLEEVDGYSLPIRFRNACAKLFSAYL